MLDPAPLTPVTLQIQRIETVPTSVRERALRELRAVTKQATDGGTDAGNAKLDAAAARKEAESFTSVRKPGMVCLLAWCGTHSSACRLQCPSPSRVLQQHHSVGRVRVM